MIGALSFTNLAVVFRVLHDEAVQFDPVPAGVFGAIPTRLLIGGIGGDGGIDHVRLLRRYRERNAALVHGRDALVELGPVRARVSRLIDSRLGTASYHDAGVPPRT